MNINQLSEIERRLSKSTAGPWELLPYLAEKEAMEYCEDTDNYKEGECYYCNGENPLLYKKHMSYGIYHVHETQAGTFGIKDVIASANEDNEDCEQQQVGILDLDDALFIAHARQDVEDLLAEVRRLKKLVPWHSDPELHTCETNDCYTRH